VNAYSTQHKLAVLGTGTGRDVLTPCYGLEDKQLGEAERRCIRSLATMRKKDRDLSASAETYLDREPWGSWRGATLVATHS
jgi:hypothetical protein